MNENKFTAEEIKKALECCSKKDTPYNCCDKCPFWGMYCMDRMVKSVPDLINRYEAELEDLREIVFTDRTEAIKLLKAESIKEFAERLTHTLVINNEENDVYFDFAYTLETIDAVKKEVMEGNC